MGKFDRYWEMRLGGPKSKGREIFKCTDCGAETKPGNGYNGEPDPGHCHQGCKSRETDWLPGNGSTSYKQNFSAIFPDSPGAGI